MMTKRCAERNAKTKRVSERGSLRKTKLVNRGERGVRYLCTRCPKGGSAIQDKAKTRNKERLIVSDEADGCFMRKVIIMDRCLAKKKKRTRTD